jgi:hypothetical protein
MKGECVIANWHFHTVAKRVVGEGFNMYREAKFLIFFLFPPASLGVKAAKWNSKEKREGKSGFKKRGEAERYASWKVEREFRVINGIEKVTRTIRREQTLLWWTVQVARGRGALRGFNLLVLSLYRKASLIVEESGCGIGRRSSRYF